MVLHTDEPHPHVHMVLKAVSEQGVRLHIRKQTLRHWRREFAMHLRALGVEANATERSVRGEIRVGKKDGIYRASLRGESSHMQQRMEAAAREAAVGSARVDPGKVKLLETRHRVWRGWLALAEILGRERQLDLAAETRRFAETMPQPITEREWLMAKLLERKEKSPAQVSPTR
jgi:hypothetical protein